MANYRQIHVSIWKDEWFLDLEPKEKLLFVYLFSNESASLAGIYKISVKVICFETCLTMDFIKKTLEKFQKSDKVHFQDGILWIKNLRKYNQGGATVQTRVEKDILSIPHCELRKQYIAYYYPNIPYPYPIDSLFYEMKCNESKCNELKGNEEGGKPPRLRLPATVKEAKLHPDIQIFTQITGMIPGQSDWNTVIETMQYFTSEKGHEIVSYLTPFWIAWSTRKTKGGKLYEKTNTAWLTDWAISGEIPQDNYRDPQRPKRDWEEQPQLTPEQTRELIKNSGRIQVKE